jgi:hypothetical protein
MNSFDPFATPMGVVLFCVVLFLTITAILMPLFVMGIYSLMKRLVKLAEENAKRIELMQLHVAQLKKRWLDEA